MIDLGWVLDNSNKMINLIERLADLMRERNVDLANAYELINGEKYQKELKKKLKKKLNKKLIGNF